MPPTSENGPVTVREAQEYPYQPGRLRRLVHTGGGIDPGLWLCIDPELLDAQAILRKARPIKHRTRAVVSRFAENVADPAFLDRGEGHTMMRTNSRRRCSSSHAEGRRQAMYMAENAEDLA